MVFSYSGENDGWTMLEYQSTWKYDFEFMKDAAQTIIDDDFQNDLQRVAVAESSEGEDLEILDDVADSGYDLWECRSLDREYKTVIIAGKSRIMDCLVQFVFFNQTRTVRLFSPDSEYFEKNGFNVFDNYMNSVEIKAYCRSAVRNASENK